MTKIPTGSMLMADNKLPITMLLGNLIKTLKRHEKDPFSANLCQKVYSCGDIVCVVQILPLGVSPLTAVDNLGDRSCHFFGLFPVYESSGLAGLSSL